LLYCYSNEFHSHLPFEWPCLNSVDIFYLFIKIKKYVIPRAFRQFAILAWTQLISMDNLLLSFPSWGIPEGHAVFIHLRWNTYIILYAYSSSYNDGWVLPATGRNDLASDTQIPTYMELTLVLDQMPGGNLITAVGFDSCIIHNYQIIN
jgi:hypothetical protein